MKNHNKTAGASCSSSAQESDDDSSTSTEIRFLSSSEDSETALKLVEDIETISYSLATWRILKLAGPYSATMVLRLGGSIAGVVMVSRLGLEELAASGLFLQVISISVAAGVGIAAPVGIMSAKIYKGDEDNKLIGLIYQRGILNSVVLAVPFAAFALFSSPIFQNLGQQRNLSELSQDFLRPYIPTIFANFISMDFEQIMLAANKPHYMLLSMVFDRALFCVLAYSFIFGKLFMPELGIAGLGVAYSISSCSAVLWQWAGLRLHPHFKSFNLFHPRWAPDWSIVRSIWMVGIMIALLQMGEMATLSVLALLLGTLSEEALAAFQVGMQFMAITLMPIIVISQSLSILCAQNLGAKNIGNVRRIGNIGTLMELMPPAIYTISAIVIPKLLVSIYIDDVNDPANQELMNTTRNMMLILGISAFPDAVRFGFTGALRGFLDTQLAMWMGFLILGLASPLGFAARELDLGSEGIMITRGLAIVAATIPLGFRWWNKSHKTVEQIEVDQQKPSCFGLSDKARSVSSSLWNSASSFFGFSDTKQNQTDSIEIDTPELSDSEVGEAVYQMA